MDDSTIGQRLKTLFLCGVGLFVAVILGYQIGSDNYRLLLLGGLFILVAAVAIFSGRYFWVLTVASTFLGGTFPVLGGAFTPFQILMLIGVVKFVFGELVLKRTRLQVGSTFDRLMITGFMGILTWHALHDRFGMRFLGSTVWGGHNYVNVYVGLAAFCVVQSIPVKSTIWAILPYFVLAVVTFDLVLGILTSIFPASIYVIYPFYSAVSQLSLEEARTGVSEASGRLGSFGNFGFVLILFVLATVPLLRILHPRNFYRLLLLGGGFFSTIFSGYRSAVINGVIGFVVAGIRDLKYAAILLLPFIAVVLFALSFINSEIFRLPKQMQRSLAFFPGKWDAEMVYDVNGSNDFRAKIWKLWANEYFPAHPWVGRGFGFRSEWGETSAAVVRGAIDYKQMVETGNLHNGLFATVDTFGIIGTVFFVFWNLALLKRSLQVSFDTRNPAGKAIRFLALYLGAWIISYWFGALSVGMFLPQVFTLAGVLLRLQQIVLAERSAVPFSATRVLHRRPDELAPV
jgi:hypothetical protein